MTLTLPQVAHAHHERILALVDRLPEQADMLLDPRAGDPLAGIEATDEFLTGTLLPHIEAAERAVYPVLERVLQNRHSLRPMRNEHDQIRRLVGEYSRLSAQLRAGGLTIGRGVALRRVIFALYALLKVHLAEEEAYSYLIERNGHAGLSEVVASALDHPVAG